MSEPPNSPSSRATRCSTPPQRSSTLLIRSDIPREDEYSTPPGAKPTARIAIDSALMTYGTVVAAGNTLRVHAVLGLWIAAGDRERNSRSNFGFSGSNPSRSLASSSGRGRGAILIGTPITACGHLVGMNQCRAAQVGPGSLRPHYIEFLRRVRSPLRGHGGRARPQNRAVPVGVRFRRPLSAYRMAHAHYYESGQR